MPYSPFAVTNQPPPLDGLDLFGTDLALTEAVERYGAGPAQTARLERIGTLGGTREALDHALVANQNPPVLRTHDRYGNRIDEVDFHPSWHWLLGNAVDFGLQAAPWTSTAPAPHVTRAAGFYLWSQVEPGHGCPISMTYAAVPALRADKALAELWEPRLASASYDPRRTAPGEKSGCLAGMGMTEKQGGSDVRANRTTATPNGDHYLLDGHKWFCSAPQADVFLVLAQAPEGLSCFVVPRVLEDGTRNTFELQRLKDKLGNRSNASSEVEFHGTVGYRLGDEGRGVPTIIEMVAATRLDCVLGSSGLMRRALVEAVWHTSHRSAFGDLLRDKPAMRGVLADLAVESEAATVLALRLAAAVDASGNEHEDALRRIALPLAKFWVCKRTPMMVAEALECLGGNGYVEESGLPLIYRESPLNSIWEGSGNVNALDVLRALGKEPAALDAWLTEVGTVRGEDPRLDAAVTDVLTSLADLSDAEARARRIAARMAVCLQAALLLQHSPAEVADAYIATRVTTDWPGIFGTLPQGTPTEALVTRALALR
jgi:putative acyl-CoA dehydrogenase